MSDQPVLFSDPRVLRIPIRECGEPLVDVRTIEALRIDSRRADPAGHYVHIRLGVVDRLVAAQTRLPAGTHLLIVEGYRPGAIAPHNTGAAVALTLGTVEGFELWMGTAVNDIATPACHTDSDRIDPEARVNRELLGTAMRSGGFVNHPTEWWDWSYGDRYWAYVTGAAAARYGPITR